MKPTASSSLTSKARPKINSCVTRASVVVYVSTHTTITRSMLRRYGFGGSRLPGYKAGDPLNYFVYPYVEVDARAFTSVDKSFSYRYLPADASAAKRHKKHK